MTTTRAFMALELPPDVRGVLARAESEIEHAAPEWRAEKWVPAENLHITLKFLGDLESDALDRVRASFSGELAHSEVCRMNFKDLKGVPSVGRCTMIWARFEDVAGACHRLATRVEQAAVGEGMQPATKPFALHVTLVRARRPRRLDPASLACANDLVATQSGFLSVPRATLFASILTRAAPVYQAIESWSLADPR